MHAHSSCQWCYSSNTTHYHAKPQTWIPVPLIKRRATEGNAISPSTGEEITQQARARARQERIVWTRKQGSGAGGPPWRTEKPPCNGSDVETSTITGRICRRSRPAELLVAQPADENPRRMSVSKAAPLSQSPLTTESSGILPIPLFLVQLWLLDWERQQRLTQTACPLPLHNPSSFCFFSSVLHALASLHSVVDLAHNLAFFRLLQRNLTLDGVVALSRQSPPSAGPHGVNNDIQLTKQANVTRPSAQETTKECFPLSLYRCLLALNRGRVKGSFCRTASSCAACACTDLTRFCYVESPRDFTAQTVGLVCFHAYRGSLLDLLLELAAKLAVSTAEETNGYEAKLDKATNILTPSQHTCVASVQRVSGKAWAIRQKDTLENEDLSLCDSNATKQLSHEKRVRPSNFKVAHENVDLGNDYSSLASATASSVQALEDEWRMSSVLHSTSSPQDSKVVAMYRELMKAIQSSADSFGCHSAFGSLLEDAKPAQDRHIRDQDSHEFLHLLIEEIQRECETSERLQEVLKSYLGRPSSLNKELCVDMLIHQSLPEYCFVSHKDHQRHRPSMDCAATMPTAADSLSDVAENAKWKNTVVVGGRTEDNVTMPSDFFNCKGYLWSLIPQSQLKSVFVGSMRESIRCLRCGVFSPERLIPFWCIHVTLSNECAAGDSGSSLTLEQLLRAALGPQRLEDVECTYCSVSATVTCLQNQMRASPLLAAVKTKGVVAGEALPARKSFNYDGDSFNNRRSVIATEMQSQLRCGEHKPIGSCTSGSPHLPSGLDSLTEVVCGGAMWQGRPAGRSVQVAAAVEGNAVKGCCTETTELLVDGDVPGLFSPFWFLPASVVSAWVRRWRLLFRLRRFLALWGDYHNYASRRESVDVQKGRKYNACRGGNEHATAAGAVYAEGEGPTVVGTSQVGSQQQTPVLPRHSVRPCPSFSFTESLGTAETEKELRLTAGDLWIVKRSPKEKLQRVGRMPSVLIIQVNALTVTRGGRLHKERTRCIFPFLLDATFITRALGGARGAPRADLREKSRSQRQKTSPTSWLHGSGGKPDHFMSGNGDEVEKMCEDTNDCVGASAYSAGVFSESALPQEAPRAVAEGSTPRECWCGLEHLYELRAVITHAGTASSAGHFACYRRWDAHAFIPGTAWCLFVRQFLSSISPAAHNMIATDRMENAYAAAKTLTVCKHQQKGERWRHFRDRVRQWLLHAARTSWTRSSFAWISDDCVRSASFAEVQAAQPYLLFYEKVSPSVF